MQECVRWRSISARQRLIGGTMNVQLLLPKKLMRCSGIRQIARRHVDASIRGRFP